MKINVVVGAPCSGKSTYVSENKGSNDIAIDYDKLAVSLGFAQSHGSDGAIKQVALEMRQAAIKKCLKIEDGSAWIIHTNPPKEIIEKYKSANAVFTVLDPSKKVCLERAKKDQRPKGTSEIIKAWYKSPPEIPTDSDDKRQRQLVVAQEQAHRERLLKTL